MIYSDHLVLTIGSCRKQLPREKALALVLSIMPLILFYSTFHMFIKLSSLHKSLRCFFLPKAICWRTYLQSAAFFVVCPQSSSSNSYSPTASSPSAPPAGHWIMSIVPKIVIFTYFF